MTATKSKPLSKICQGDYTAWPQWAQEAAQSVQIAPSAMNTQPWQLAFSGGSLALIGSNRSQIDMGIALAHMYVTYPETFAFEVRQNAPKKDGFYYTGTFSV